jgi:hypothetical protein
MQQNARIRRKLQVLGCLLAYWRAFFRFRPPSLAAQNAREIFDISKKLGTTKV